MMRYLLIISYDGTNFCGYQLQKKDRTVQGELERALKILTKQDIGCIASGRTDAGVHAIRQYVHFDIDERLDLQKTKRSLNGILPEDVKVLEMAQTDVHCRFSAKRKTYLYKIYLSEIELPLYKNRALRIDPNVDINAMEQACKILIGEHDFVNFCASNSEVKTTSRTIYDCHFEKNDNELNFYITGNGFLYKMVRNIIGILLLVGMGKIKSQQDFVKIAFDNSINLQNATLSKNTMPPHGLYLFDVAY